MLYFTAFLLAKDFKNVLVEKSRGALRLCFILLTWDFTTVLGGT
jgi:hypothetical protein